jgi:hypothetical protein
MPLVLDLASIVTYLPRYLPSIIIYRAEGQRRFPSRNRLEITHNLALRNARLGLDLVQNMNPHDLSLSASDYSRLAFSHRPRRSLTEHDPS